MTKTELQKQRVKAVLEFLTDQFDAQIEDADGGRLDITIGEFNGQMHRRDLQVDFYDSIPLGGHGFTPAEIIHHHLFLLCLNIRTGEAGANAPATPNGYEALYFSQPIFQVVYFIL